MPALLILTYHFIVKAIYSVGFLGCLERFRGILFTPLVILVSSFLCIGSLGFGKDPMAYSIFFLQEWLLIFIAGWGSVLLLYAKQGSAIKDEDVVVDVAAGIVLTMALSVPATIYTAFAVNSWLSLLCLDYIYCFPSLYYLGYFLGIILPVASYYCFYKLRPFPISWVDLHLRNSFATMCDDILIAGYGLLLTYGFTIIFLHGNATAILQFFRNLWVGWLFSIFA